MTKEKFKRLVTKLEKESKQNPEAYQRKVFLWALLGYSYAIFMAWAIVLLLALIGIGSWIALQHQDFMQTSNLVILGILLVVLLVLIVGSFRAKFPEPEGILLSRKQADKLHRLIDELRQKLKAPKVHRILITDDFNAAIVQWPRLGIFGWSRNYLILGLPYLGAMSVEEMKSVIAHEMGHLSHQHSRRAGRIYQLRLSWSRMLSANEYRRTRGQLIFRRFLYWYAPIFSAYAFVLSRVNEYTADRCAAETIGRNPFIQSLIRGEIIHRYLDRRFWKRVYDRAATQVNPVKNVYLQMLKGFRIDIKPEAQSLWLEQALIEKTDTSDTHPCLNDRLEALGVTTEKGGPLRLEDGRLQLPPVVEKNAAEELLGENLTKRLAALMAENWSDAIRDQWLARYQSAYKAQQRMKQLAKDAEILKPAEKDAWERAQLTAEFGDKELARTLLEQFVEDYPEHLQARYGLGNLLLEAGDEAGIPYLEHVMEQDAEAVLPVCEAVYSFWMEKGKFAEATSYLDRARKMYERLEDDRLERISVNEEDTFLPHGIPYERLRLLIESLRDFDPWLKAVYLVQKKLSVLPGRPLYVLGVVATKPIFANVTMKQVEEQLGMALRFQFQQQGAIYVLILNKENETFLHLFQQIPEAKIYGA